MINVIIVDDYNVILDGISFYLQQMNEMNVVGAVRNENELFNVLSKHQVDVVLLDIQLGKTSGVKLLKNIKIKYPFIKILMLTTYPDQEYILDCVLNGANGFLLIECTLEQIADAIRFVHEDQIMMPSSIMIELAKKLKKEQPFTDEITCKMDLYEWGRLNCELTLREKHIATMLANSHTNSEISAELFLTIGTIKNYVSRLFKKLEVSNRSDAMILLRKIKKM